MDVDDIKETNEFIDDSEEARATLLTQDEIADLRREGRTPQEIIDRQIARHQGFDLKTDFSKEKWRKRKEKKYVDLIV
jgi:tRNA (adenine-N(1)-)-methyltransferase non-catalytic subunit